MYGKIENDKIKYFTPYKGGLLLNDFLIINPTEAQYNEAGWYRVENIAEDGTDEIIDGVIRHYIGAPLPPYKPSYAELVEQKIRMKYSMSDEFAILRQRDTKADEFSEYFDFCEKCKAEAKDELEMEE